MQEMEGKGKGELLVLREDLFLGHGVHKAAYIDPRDPSRCVKVVFRMPDYDLMKELGYRRSRRRRGLSSELLPAYYGTVETNKGMGYVFERVVDYDGHRKTQALNCYIQLAAILVETIVCGALVYYTSIDAKDVTFRPGFALCTPIIVMIFLLLAHKGIMDDERLVRAADRIR